MYPTKDIIEVLALIQKMCIVYHAPTTEFIIGHTGVVWAGFVSPQNFYVEVLMPRISE